MTLLQKAYQTLNQDKKEKKPFLLELKRPEKEVEFIPFNIPQVRSVKCTKEKLSKVLAFIEMKKFSRFSEGLTVMNISCNSKRLLSMCGSPANVSNLIKYMKNIGLLADYDSTYQFNGFYERLNRSKSYVYCKEVEDKIKEYCNVNNINKYLIKNNNYTIVKKFTEQIKSFESSEVRFSSKLQLYKPDNFSKKDFEEYLTLKLYENYPQLKYYQNLADEINETYFAEDYDRQIQFTPKFTWNKGEKAVTKIGIRATNSLVSAKKEEEEDDKDWIIYRKDVLKRYGLSYEFDVKSSVPRVTYLLSNGVWLDNDIDLYKKMYDRFIQYCPTEKLEWNKETREIFKSFHMRGYFDTYAMLAAHTKRAIALKGSYVKEDWKDLDVVMRAYKLSIEETVGELKYDSEIFFHESCIYMDVLKSLLDDGFDVLQIYDGFYTNKGCKGIEERIKMITECYYKRYFKEVINDNNNDMINNTIVKKFTNDIESLVSLALEDVSDLTDIEDFGETRVLPKDHKIEHDQYRENILESKFPGVALEERDRIASIHNLNRFLKTGVLAGNNRETEDFYKYFAGKNLTKEERDDYKTLMMTFYFSSQQKWNSLVRHVVDYFYKDDTKAHAIAKKGVDRFKAAWKLLGYETFSSTDELEEALRNFYRENRARLQEVEGELIGKEIFLYENVQNLSTEIELRKLGYIVETVYDGFYTNAPEETWWKVYKEKLLELKTLTENIQEI